MFIGIDVHSLDFKLYVFIPRRIFYHNMLHALTNGIERGFRKAGISIAFPHCEIHFHPMGPLEVQLARKRVDPSGLSKEDKPENDKS